MRFVPVLLVILVAVAGIAQAPIRQRDLIGVWQYSKFMAAGWHETYQFFSNGKVIHSTNTMDPYTRLRSESGTWRLSGNRLTVRYTQESVLVGGTRLAEKDIMEGDFGYTGYKLTSRSIRSPRVKSFSLSGFLPHDKPYVSLKFGDKRMYRFSTDPRERE